MIAIGYKGYNSAIAQRQFFTTEDTHFSLHLNPASTEEVKGVMNRYDDFENENQIAADLLFMDEFYAEDQRQQALSHDRDVMRRLYWVAFPCFDYGGMKLFEENCAICHHQNLVSKLTGPALLGVKQKWNDDVALYSFIRNSQRLIGQGYPRAVEEWKMWKPTLMSDFEDLTDDEIAAILKFTR